MKHLSYLLLLAVVLFACSSSAQKTMQPAETGKKTMMQETEKRAMEPVSDIQKAQLEKYYALASTEEEIESLSNDVFTQLESDLVDMGNMLDAEKLASARAIVKKETDPKRMLVYFKSHFSRNYDASHLSATMKWLENPLAKKLHEMEKVLSKPGGDEAMIQYAQTLSENPPAAERMALVEKFIAVMDLSENMKEMALDLISGSMKSLSAALPADQRMSNEQLVEARNQMKGLLGPQMEAIAPVMILFMYQEATDADIQKLTEFYGSDAGQWYSNAERTSLLSMVSETYGNVYKSLHATSVK